MSIGRGVLAASLLLLCASAEGSHGGSLTWSEYGPGMEAARRSGKPAVIYFTADW